MIARVTRTVLLVDDDPAFLALAARVCEGIGLRVAATAETAAAGLAAAHAVKPDAALVDVGLPDRSGIDLGRELAALSWGPRVVLTSTDHDAVRITPRGSALPFIPKEDLANSRLRKLLISD
jgi:DNA-binding response OmpR family regulator